MRGFNTREFMDETGETLVSSGSAEESEEGECSSSDEENPSSLPEPPEQVLVEEEIDSEGEEREVESGDKIKPEKLMQLGSSCLSFTIACEIQHIKRRGGTML